MPQLLERCHREDAVEQARQSQVDEEKAHPGEPGFRDAELQLAADEAEKDQPEERQSEVEDVEHAGLIVPDRPPNAKKAGRENLTRSSGHAASADLPRSMMVHQRVRSNDAYKLHQDETRIAQLLERCQREDAVEQARQSQVDEEKAHPGEPGFGDAELQLAADEAEKDQPEERQSEVEDIYHAGLIVPAPPPNAKKAGRDNLTRSSGHAASADLPRSMMVHQHVRSNDAYNLHHATILV